MTFIEINTNMVIKSNKNVIKPQVKLQVIQQRL